jgi:shikimate kinase
MFLFRHSHSSPYTNTQKVDQSNLAGVSASDLAIISAAAQISEDAETGTGGFNDAIAAAGGTATTSGKALQNGKIKNKVLKLQTDVLRIQIEVNLPFFHFGMEGWIGLMK